MKFIYGSIVVDTWALFVGAVLGQLPAEFLPDDLSSSDIIIYFYINLGSTSVNQSWDSLVFY